MPGFRYAIALVLVSASAHAASEVGRSFRAVAPAEGVEHVRVNIPAGKVSILSGPQAQIRIEGTIRRAYSGGANRRERAREIIEDTAVEVVRRGDRAFIREKLGPEAKRWGRWVRSELQLEIILPAGVNLEVEQSTGKLDIRGDFLDLGVHMNAGQISLRLPKNKVKELTAGATVGELRADLGHQVISKEGLLAGRTHFINEGGSGIVEVRLRVGRIDISLD